MNSFIYWFILFKELQFHLF